MPPHRGAALRRLPGVWRAGPSTPRGSSSAGTSRPRVSASRHSSGDQAVGLAGHHVVHPREAPVRGLAHDGLAVGAAEHGDDAGIELAHPAQQRQRRHVLLEGGRAADHAGAGGEHPARGLVDELGGRRAQRQQVRGELARRGPRTRPRVPVAGLADLAQVLGVPFGPPRVVTEGRAGERPLAGEEHDGHGRTRTAYVPAQPDALGEPQVGVGHRRGDAALGQDAPASRPERHGRPGRRGVRHRDQADVRARPARRRGHRHLLARSATSSGSSSARPGRRPGVAGAGGSSSKKPPTNSRSRTASVWAARRRAVAAAAARSARRCSCPRPAARPARRPAAGRRRPGRAQVEITRSLSGSTTIRTSRRSRTGRARRGCP